MGVTNFPNGISTTSVPVKSLGTAAYYGSDDIVNGAGTITTGLTTCSGFALGIAEPGTAAQAEAYTAGGSISSGDIVVSVFAYGGTAMGGTATIYWTAWGS